MQLRLVRFELEPNAFDAAKVIFDTLTPVLKSQPGCKEVLAFGDKASGSYGFSVLWESVEASEEAGKIIGPKLFKHLEKNKATNNPFNCDLFEVFQQ